MALTVSSDSGALPVITRPAIETIPTILAAQHLQKIYGRGAKQVHAVRDVSLSMRLGEVLAFLGPNGAGKTTCIKMIAGLIRPDRGQVRIADRDPHQDARALRSVGAVLEGNRNLYWRLTPIENLEYFGVLRGLSPRLARRYGLELLAQFDLMAKQHTPVQQLSRGMQQKLAIAVALVHQPRLLLLDEPTLGLDVEASQHVKQLIRAIAQAGCGILLTTHQLDVAEELSDRVAVIRQGEIIAERPTRELIQEFSGSSYRIELAEDLDEPRSRAVIALGAVVGDRAITYTGSTDGLYDILHILEPVPFIQIKKDDADLAAVFLKLIKGAAGDRGTP